MSTRQNRLVEVWSKTTGVGEKVFSRWATFHCWIGENWFYPSSNFRAQGGKNQERTKFFLCEEIVGYFYCYRVDLFFFFGRHFAFACTAFLLHKVLRRDRCHSIHHQRSSSRKLECREDYRRYVQAPALRALFVFRQPEFPLVRNFAYSRLSPIIGEHVFPRFFFCSILDCQCSLWCREIVVLQHFILKPFAA